MNKALVGKKILIIDDEVVFRTMLTEYFSHEKACVYATDNGSQALLLLEEGLRPDLILCDIRMPVMNGPTFFMPSRAASLVFSCYCYFMY